VTDLDWLRDTPGDITEEMVQRICDAADHLGMLQEQRVSAADRPMLDRLIEQARGKLVRAVLDAHPGTEVAS
jgi:hypothetical protein